MKTPDSCSILIDLSSKPIQCIYSADEAKKIWEISKDPDFLKKFHQTKEINNIINTMLRKNMDQILGAIPDYVDQESCPVFIFDQRKKMNGTHYFVNKKMSKQQALSTRLEWKKLTLRQDLSQNHDYIDKSCVKNIFTQPNIIHSS